jgi:hypothetical protein
MIGRRQSLVATVSRRSVALLAEPSELLEPPEPLEPLSTIPVVPGAATEAIVRQILSGCYRRTTPNGRRRTANGNGRLSRSSRSPACTGTHPAIGAAEHAERAAVLSRQAGTGTARLRVSDAGWMDVPKILSTVGQACKRHPEVSIELAEMSGVEQILALRADAIDAAFARPRLVPQMTLTALAWRRADLSPVVGELVAVVREASRLERGQHGNGVPEGRSAQFLIGSAPTRTSTDRCRCARTG